MKLSILDNGLKDRTGHHYNYTMALALAAREKNWDVTVHAYKMFQDADKPSFDDYLYALTSSGRQSDILDNYLRKAAAYKMDIEADVVLIHTANHTTLYGLCHSNIRARKIVAVLCLPGFYDPISHSYTMEGLLYQHAMAKAAEMYPQLEFKALSEPMAQQLTELSGIKVEVMDTFCPEMPIAKPTPKPGQRLKVGYFGHTTGVKRGDLIAPLTQGFPSVDFIIHENPIGSLGVKEALNVDLYKGELSTERYLEYLNRCDIVLLPYEPNYYKDSISNILIESLCLGKVMIIPHDTWMWMLAGDSGAPFHKPELLEGALRYAISHHEELRANAIAKVGEKREKYSVNNYLRVIGIA